MKEIDEYILEGAKHLAWFGQLILNQGWVNKELRELEEGVLKDCYIDLAATFLDFISKAGIDKEDRQQQD